jgi:ribosome-associated protein
LETRNFVDKIIDLIQNKRGKNIRILDLKKLTPIADYFVICSGESDTQVKAIADEVDKKLADEGIKCYYKEGYGTLNWVLLDYFDVVVHVFKNEARQFYNLEKLWGDAPVEEIADEED